VLDAAFRGARISCTWRASGRGTLLESHAVLTERPAARILFEACRAQQVRILHPTCEEEDLIRSSSRYCGQR